MHDAQPPAPPRKRFSLRWTALILLALTFPTGFWAARCMMPNPPAAQTVGGEITVGGVPLFATWPKGVTPEVAIVLTGQTYGYMSPCGCSRPQKGGLERRANFLKDLRAKGWPVMAVDLGDVAPPKKIQDQDYLKYEVTMKALAEMGYSAVGLGVQDFDQQLFNLLAKYTLQKSGQPPIILAANLGSKDAQGAFVPREKLFDVPGQRPMVEAYEVVSNDAKATGKALPHLPVGVVGVVGPDVATKLQKIDPTFSVAKVDNTLPGVIAAMQADPKKPVINVLLYDGSKDDTPDLAKKYPQFNVILCQSEESEPPQFPTVENNGQTFVIQIGHKGQNVGVIGVFKNGNGYELKYQLVPLGEEFLTPPGPAAAKLNAALQLMEEYTGKVKKDNLIAKLTAKPIPHEAQIENPAANLSFVGSEKCQTCHVNEFDVWKKSKHSHAMEALEAATRPGNRQFDGDCVQCHSIGFGYQTGYTDAKATPQLKHVGCESCHGPGSGHVTQPNNKALLASLSKWKSQPTDVLPAKAVIEKLGELKPGQPAPVQIKPAEQQLINAVSARCMRCHDQENDPKFDFYKYMPQIWHSGFKAGNPAANAANGLPPGAK
ncbi:multiheme c-type cytochrome [Limnoglobus roseus]|uniref:Cytochrome c554 n=1 Tax=Limnoglobus roseus TaxID=2598579 RepID=A0A5C1ALX5_9BACT|nr:multiheme c-type cytochrome [Limnoglobus roseus]QEL18174.1 cytochrome c554 [Limnoglobus roseus]